MLADRSRGVAPSESRTARYTLQCLLAFQAVALAFEGRPPPSKETLLITVLEWAALFGLRAAVSTPGERWRHLAPVAFTLGVAGVMIALGGPLRLARFDPVWVAWCGIPVALLTDGASLRFGRRLPIPFGLMILASVALGLAGSQPWTRDAGRGLLVLFACTAVVLFVFSFSEAFEHRTRRSGVLSTQSPSPPIAALGRFGLGLSSSVLAVALLCSLLLWGVGKLIAPSDADQGSLVVTRPDAEEWPDSPDEPDWDPLNVADLLRSADDDSVVALATATEEGEPVLRPLYLREHVLSEYEPEASVPLLSRRRGARVARLDPGDGRADGVVHFEGLEALGFSAPAFAALARQRLEVLQIQRRDGACLYEPHLAWMGSRSLEIGPDSSVWVGLRPVGATLTSASDPSMYFLEGVDGANAERGGPIDVPQGIADGAWLERVSSELLRGRSDLEKVRALSRTLRENGRWQLPPVWDGSYRSFLEGEMAGVCAHFAQTAALLCRLSGIPARVAVGYVAREYDAQAQRHVVRGRNRHAWLEVPFQGFGWVAFEVTPAMPGDASDQLGGPGAEDAEDEASAPAPTEDEAPPTPGAGLRLPSFQPTLPPSWVWGAVALAAAVLLWVLCAPARLRAQAGEGTPVLSPTERRAGGLLAQLERVCQRHGLRRGPGETPACFIGRVAERAPRTEDALRELNELYHASRFGGRELSELSVQQLRAILRDLPGALSQADQDAASGSS